MTRARIVLLATFAALLLLLPGAAAAGGGGHALCDGFSEGAAVTLADNCFDGVAHFLTGDQLTVRNEGAVAHTYTAVDGTFDSGRLEPGQRATLTVPAGVHRVYCTLHADGDGAGMAGVVLAGDAAAATAAAGGSPALAGSDSAAAGPWTVALTLLLASALALAAGLAARGRARANAHGSTD